MAINRRSLLKALAAAPALPLFRLSILSALAGEARPYGGYILLHGMFFLEFFDNKLYVATPVHSGHKFHKRPHGQAFLDLQRDIDLTGQLLSGNVFTFPTELPQFSGDLISQRPGGIVLPSATTYQCRIKLPLPKYIFAYRTDKKSNFRPDRNTAIGDAIFKNAGPRVATITCLQYETGASAPFVDSYYAEHCGKPLLSEVNQALADAQSLLGPKFKLQMKDVAQDAAEDDDDSLPDGVTHADENELREFTEVHPADCVPLVGSGLAHKVADEVRADVASCPQFGITHP